MGQTHSTRWGAVNAQHLKPQGLYASHSIAHKQLKHLRHCILKGALAPCFPGSSAETDEVGACLSSASFLQTLHLMCSCTAPCGIAAHLPEVCQLTAYLRIFSPGCSGRRVPHLFPALPIAEPVHLLLVRCLH